MGDQNDQQPVAPSQEAFAVCRDLVRVADVVQHHLDQRLAAVDVTFGQVMALSILAGTQRPVTITGLGLALGRGVHRAAALAKGLEASGWIERVPPEHDRRRAPGLQLTEAGRAILAEVLPLAEVHTGAVLANLPPDVLAALRTALAAMASRAV